MSKKALREDGRIEDGRTFQEREQDARDILSMSFNNALDIPKEMIPQGWEYYWVRKSIRGEVDTARMIEMRKKGWNPVPADRHPELVFEDFFGRVGHQGMIEQGGLILCERRKEIGDVERKMRDEKNLQIQTSMPGTENFMGEPSIPVQNSNQTYITKNASFGR